MINTQTTPAPRTLDEILDAALDEFDQDQPSSPSPISSALAVIQEASNILPNFGIIGSRGEVPADREPVRFVVNTNRAHSQTAFPRLSSPDATLIVLSFLKPNEIAHFLRTSQGACQLKGNQNNRLERLIFSQVPIFGRAQYQHYWGVAITDEFDPQKIDIRVLRTFLKTYYGPNPVDSRQLVKNTCLIPTVVPEGVTVEGRVFDFNLQLLEQIARHPGGRGNQAQYSYETAALDQHGTVKAERANLVLLLQGVVGRNKPWSKESENPNERGQVQALQDLNARTEYGCEEEPDALSQDTVLFAHHAVTGQRPFGDSSGMEGRYTYGRTRELVPFWKAYHMVSGCFEAGAVDPLGGSAPAGLRVTDAVGDSELYGVGVLRKF